MLQQNSTNQLPVVIAKLLQKREINDVEDYLSWDLKKLPLLTGLKDLPKAAQRLIKAANNKEVIAVYGDYDVDGTTSCALLWHFFKMIGIEVECIQPSRFIEGYGIHPPTIDESLVKNIKVLITVDCGITNNETADYARKKGIDLIITDHHKDAREEMPDAFAVINPNRRDEDLESPLTALAGVGVAFALALEIKNQMAKNGIETPSLYPLLQFVAIGTICDLAKLNPMNLKLCRHGLKQIPGSHYSGIRAFFTPEERELSFMPSEKISFGVGPLINSKGRLDHPKEALNLLISNDSDDAFRSYSILHSSNTERKFIQSEVNKEAIELIEDEDQKINIVYQPHWHEGVIGIVASKLVETYRVPAMVFTDAGEDGIIKASIRSAGKLNIFDLLQESSELFIKFGGHKAAAGLSMPKENLDKLKENAINYLDNVPEILRTKQSSVDLVISPEEVTPTLVKTLEMLEPFGMGNEKPVFKMSGVRLDSYDLMKDIHVRWNFTGIKNSKIKLKGLSFNYIGAHGKIHPEEIFNEQSKGSNELTIYFTLGINRWKGREYIQLMLEKIALLP
jgi:single-stranded-DNA-specific exonuclease